MTFDGSLLEFFADTVAVEPYSSQTSAQAPSYGASVTYRALVEGGLERQINVGGRLVRSSTKVTIPDRVFVDARSRLTLPAGFTPSQPPIYAVTHLKGLGLDHTVLDCA